MTVCFETISELCYMDQNNLGVNGDRAVCSCLNLLLCSNITGNHDKDGSDGSQQHRFWCDGIDERRFAALPGCL